MAERKNWSRQELLVAFALYCQLPFGKLHARNPEIIKFSGLIGRTPSALAMKLTNIASLDPEVTSTGRRGLSSVSVADREMWDEMQGDWEKFALASEKAVEACQRKDASLFKDGVEVDVDYSGQTKVVPTLARIGQSFFRKSVLSAYNFKCGITGLSVQSLLVASHIVPWKMDEKNRLNPSNGIALSALHDRAFDSGIITINEDMTVLVAKLRTGKSDRFYASTLQKYHGKPLSIPDKFVPRPDFLSYHRENIFKG